MEAEPKKTELAKTLAAAGIFIVVIVTGLVDYQVARDPRARPESFTASDGAELQRQINEIRSDHARFEEDIRECRVIAAEVRDYIEKHEEWGQDMARVNAEWRGKIEAEHMEFQRKFESLFYYR